MNHSDHVALLRGGVEKAGSGGVLWADLGSGGGAFTLALAELLGPGGRIVSVDRDRGALREQAAAMAARFPEVELEQRVADFTGDLGLPSLDGIVMANSLHFQPDRAAVIRRVRAMLRPGGRLVIVEYDADRGNPWVPYPLPFTRLPEVAACAGFSSPRLLGSRPSRYHRRVYSAVCMRAGA